MSPIPSRAHPRESVCWFVAICGLHFVFCLPSLAQEARWHELNVQVIQLYEQGKYAEAVPLAQESLQLAEATFGPKHPNVATSLDNLATLYQKQGRYSEAEPLCKRALAIREEVLGLDDPQVAMSLNNLAVLYRKQGRYTEAEPLYKRAVAIKEKAIPRDDRELATSLDNLASLYEKQGRYAEAELLVKRALVIQEALGPDDPDVATSLNIQAMLYDDQGLFAEAEPLYKRALAIREKALGPDHPNVAESLNNLGQMYREQGRYSEAEPFFKRALAIREVANFLNNLAVLYDDQDRYAEAEPLYIRALYMDENELGPDDPDVASDLNNLAFLYKQQNRLNEAEAFLQRALAIREKALGPEHPLVALSLNNLAFVYKEQGRYTDAEQLFKRALAIQEKTFGPNHPDVAASLVNLAGLFYVWRRPAQAAPLFDRALGILSKQFEYYSTYMSEKDRLGFLTKVQAWLPVYFSFCFTYRQQFPELAGKIYNMVLWQKGLIAQSVAALRAKILAGGDAEALKLFDQVVAKRDQYAALIAAQPSDFEQWRKDLDQMPVEANELEEQLVRRSAVFAKSKAVTAPSWRDVQKALGRDEAAVEIVRFDFHDGKKWTGKTYVALVLTSASKDAPALIDLGDAATLEGALQAAYYHRIAPPSSAVVPWGTDCSSLASAPSSPARGIRATSADPMVFYNSFWKPIESGLNGATRIYLSTDGVLNQVAMGLIPAPDGKLLMENYDLRLVNRTADLLQPAAAHTEQSAALFANPDFNLTEASFRNLLANHDTPESGSLLAAIPQLKETGTTLGGCMQLRQLPDLELGVTDQIAPMLRDHGWTAKTYVGEHALLEAVEQVQSPRLLHIATHGDFLPDPAAKKAKPVGGNQSPLLLIFDPMLRSRLFFAGANQTLAGHALPADSTGILTAYQASTLNLQGTELVVLSACETGRGEVLDGEGVFGLRRAFQEAGAESVLMTLWEVPAKETQELLSDFYRHWLLDGMNKHQALAAAQDDERKQVQQRYGRDLPYYWGAFVLVGR